MSSGWERDRFVQQVLRPLLAGRPGRYQRWDFDRNVGAEWHTVPTGVPVVVEGVSATDVRLGVPWDFTIWVEVPYEVRLARALERDGPGADGPLADRLDAERGRVRRGRSDLRTGSTWCTGRRDAPEPGAGPSSWLVR